MSDNQNTTGDSNMQSTASEGAGKKKQEAALNTVGADKKPHRVAARNGNITILGDDNFRDWKWHLKYHLKALDLYDAVTMKDFDDEARDDEAMYEIICTLSDKVKCRVSHCRKAYELYGAIEAIYANTTAFSITDLNMKLANFKFKNLDQINQGISEIQSIVGKLKNLKESVSDRMVEGVLLAALPSSFKTFVTVWKGMPEVDRTVQNLINRIQAEAEDMKLFVKDDNKALFVKGNPGQGNNKNFRRGNNRGPKNKNYNKKSGGNPNIKCYNCGKTGHMKKDCRKPLKNNESGHNKGNQNNHHNSKDDRKSGNSNSGDKGHVNNKDSNEISFMAVTCKGSSTLWIADSGASRHMTSHREWFHDYIKFDEPKEVIAASAGSLLALGIGSIKSKSGVLTGVWYVPEITANLFSIGSAAKRGLQIAYDQESVVFYKDGEEVIRGWMQGSIYMIDIQVIIDDTIYAGAARTIGDWHKCLGHVSAELIENMARKNIVDGLNIEKSENKAICEHCLLNKGHRVSHPSRVHELTYKPGNSLHMDTVHTKNEVSLGGSRYFLLAKDEASGYRKVFFLESKADVPDKVKLLISKVEEETGNNVLSITSDNGTEFVNHKLGMFLVEKGINHHTSAPYTPEQNGYIERDVRTIVESARTMLNEAKLSKELWAEAVNTAIHVMNRVPNKRNPDATPYELWFGERPNIKNLRIFGQEAIVNKTPINKGGKWDMTGEVMKFVGYTDLLNTYRFYSEEKKKIIVSCDAKFLHPGRSLNHQINEKSSSTSENVPTSLTKFIVMRKSKHNDDTADSDGKIDVNTSTRSRPIEADEIYSDIPETVDMDLDASILSSTTNTEEIINLQEDNDDQGMDQQEAGQAQERPNNTGIPRNLFIQNRPPVILETRMRPRSGTFTKERANLATLETDDDPSSYSEAMRREDSPKWMDAMKQEIRSMVKNDVWTLVDRPKEANIVSNRWVLRIKRKPDGEIDRYRARLVARGFSQVYGIDYLETFAPVVNMVSVRFLLAYAAINNLFVKQFDVATAFLYGKLEEEIFMEQPEGFEDGSKQVCLLKRGLYGLKQAPRQWNKEFSSFLKAQNLKESQHDRCIYYRNGSAELYIAIYVDDGIILAKNKSDIDYIINELRRKFDIHEVSTSTFLGFQLEIDRTKRAISLHQTSYINKVLKKYSMQDASSVDNPSTTTRHKALEESSPAVGNNIPYRQAIGSLLYAGNITRIDIAYAVNKASRKVASPTAHDWQSVKRIFRYLRNKEDDRIRYSKDDHEGLVAYVDADFAGDESSKSTTGYVIFFGGGPIAWKSCRQEIVTISSTEAELDALMTVTHQLIWMRDLGKEIGIIKEEPTKVYCDNMSTIRLAMNEKSVQRTRNMGVRAAFVRQHVQAKDIDIEHVKTDKNIADFPTKPLTTSSFTANKLKTMIFSMMLCITLCGAVLFEATKPIIWLPMPDHFVDGGTAHFIIDYALINPCIKLEQQLNQVYSGVKMKRQFPNQIPMMQQGPILNQAPNQNQGQTQNMAQIMNPGMIKGQPVMQTIFNPNGVIIKELVSECHLAWSQYVIPQAKMMVNNQPPPSADQMHNRGKRSILETATNLIGAINPGFGTGLICGTCVCQLLK